MQDAILVLLVSALIVVQALIGGARAIHALPCYLAIALAGLGVWALRKEKRVRPFAFCLVSTAAFALYVALRALFSPVPSLARADLFTALAALVVYLICAIFLSGTRERFAILLALVLVGIVHVGIGLVQLITQENFMLLPWIFRPDYGFRASGLFISPNHLATMLGMLGVLTLSICCWSRVEISTRAFAFYGFMACLTGIALTGSRGGYFSTVAGLILFLALSAFLAKRFNRPHFFGLAMATAVLLTAIVAAALVTVVQSEIYEKRLRHVQDPSRLSEMLAPAAREQHALSPVFGTGAGTFLYYGRQFHGPEVQSDPQHVHNEYLELLAEYGWAGAVLFGLFLLAHFAAAVAGIRRVLEQKLKPTAWTASNELALIAGSLCALAIGLVHAGRDFTFHLPANALVAAFLFAILANPTVESARQSAHRLLPVWMSAAPPVFALLLLALALPRIPGAASSERARVALRDRDYPGALVLARKTQRADPADADAFYYEGEALRYLALEADDPPRATDLRRQAAAAFESGLKVFPQDLRLLLKLGQVADDLGDLARADDCFRPALEAAPNSGIVHACCGVHWHRQRQFAKAAHFYREAQRLGETAISAVGLRDLEHDRAVARSNDAFADLLPDPVEPR